MVWFAQRIRWGNRLGIRRVHRHLLSARHHPNSTVSRESFPDRTRASVNPRKWRYLRVWMTKSGKIKIFSGESEVHPRKTTPDGRLQTHAGSERRRAL